MPSSVFLLNENTPGHLTGGTFNLNSNTVQWSRKMNYSLGVANQNGSNILAGVYVFRLSVRSLSDGSKKQANKKLVIIN